MAGEVIKRAKQLALVDGIQYRRIGDDSFYCQELFQTNELMGYLRNMLADNGKSVLDHVIYDSAVERNFAEQLQRNQAVKVFAKLPAWFEIPTPLGAYRPDWAVLIDANGEERLYFVVETKGSMFLDDLRDQERAKIECGKAHFKALATGDNPARYIQATNIEDVMKYA
jgi:type III restriction enzyme